MQTINNDLESGGSFTVEKAFSEVSAEDYDALIVQDVYLIEKINELVDALGEGESKEDKRLRLPGEEGKEYRHIEVRIVEMSDEMAQSLDFASKIDRRPSFIRKLMDHGEERAGECLGSGALTAGGS